MELSGADLLLYAKACRQRLAEIDAQQQALREEVRHLQQQLQTIEGGHATTEPKNWRGKLNAFAQQHGCAFTYHQAAAYIREQGWHNGLGQAKLKSSVAATLARLAANGNYCKTSWNETTHYGLPAWFDGATLKKKFTPL